MNFDNIYRKILEYMEEGVLTISLDGTVTTFNPAAETILSLKVDNVLGKKFAEAFIPIEHADEFSQMILDSIVSSKKINNKIISITVNNIKKIIDVTTSFLFDDNGNKIGIIVVFSDVTEIESLRITEKKLLKELEEEHKKLQKSYLELEEKTETLKQLSGKFNKLKFIGVILIFSIFFGLMYMMEKDYLVTEKYFNFTRKVENSKIKENYAVAKVQPIVKTIGFLGTISPITNINIVSPYSGQIEKLYFNFGHSVHKGEILCKIDPSEIMVKLREAEINFIKQRNQYEKLKNWMKSPNVSAAKRQLYIAEKSFENSKNELSITKELYKKGIVSKEELNTAVKNLEISKNSYESAKENLQNVINVASSDNLKIAKIQLEIMRNNLENLRKNLREGVIISPINGVILPVNNSDGKKQLLTIGTHVSEGESLFSIGDLAGFSIRINISESDISKLKVGMNVNVVLDAFKNYNLRGKVSSLSLVPSNQDDKTSIPTYSAVIVIRHIPKGLHNKILIGMSAKADIIIYKNESAVIVPVACVGEENGRFYVIKKAGKRVVKTFVTIGNVGEEGVEIKKGVKVGDRVKIL